MDAEQIGADMDRILAGVNINTNYLSNVTRTLDAEQRQLVIAALMPLVEKLQSGGVA